MNPEELIPVYLTKADAASFKKWREHQALFELLLKHSIFDIKNGSAELHFDPAGHLASIDAHVKVYRKTSPRPVINTVIIEDDETP